MKLSIFTTMSYPWLRQDPYLEAIQSYLDLADEVIIVDGCNNDDWTKDGPSQAYKRDTFELKQLRGYDRLKFIHYPWPEEFSWEFIGQQFQRGYDECTGDWVIRADLDYIFHEKDFEQIRFMLSLFGKHPAASFLKYQFLLIDRYQIKSRVVSVFNKGEYGSDIKLNGGGDLCQPVLNGNLIESDQVPETKVPVFNYDFCFKSEKVIARDFSRFTRAWHRRFGDWPFGGPSHAQAFKGFKQMMMGRFEAREWEKVPIEFHPIYIQERIRNLTPDRFGYSMFNWQEKARYYANN